MTDALVLKLTLTPLLILIASLLGRRYGASVSGWLVGLPLTSGPVVFIVAFSHDSHFVVHVAIGVIVATASQVAFALVYSRLAKERRRILVCLAAGVLIFTALTVLLLQVRFSTVTAVIVALVALLAAASMTRHSRSQEIPVTRLPAWNIPLRMVVATLLVVLLTGLAPLLGPALTGLLTPFPVYASVLTVFAHRDAGEEAARGVLQGLIVGLFAFVGFFTVIAGVIQALGIGPTFSLAVLAALSIQGLSLLYLTRFRNAKTDPAVPDPIG